jgi:hypothetical protein
MRVKGGKQASRMISVAVKAIELMVIIVTVSAVLFTLFGGSSVFPRTLRGTSQEYLFHPGHARNLTHLIMVAGFSVTVTNELSKAETDERVWYLMPYQVCLYVHVHAAEHRRSSLLRS